LTLCCLFRSFGYGDITINLPAPPLQGHPGYTPIVIPLTTLQNAECATYIELITAEFGATPSVRCPETELESNQWTKFKTGFAAAANMGNNFAQCMANVAMTDKTICETANTLATGCFCDALVCRVKVLQAAMAAETKPHCLSLPHSVCTKLQAAVPEPTPHGACTAAIDVAVAANKGFTSSPLHNECSVASCPPENWTPTTTTTTTLTTTTNAPNITTTTNAPNITTTTSTSGSSHWMVTVAVTVGLTSMLF